jgi:hypothetical protein
MLIRVSDVNISEGVIRVQSAKAEKIAWCGWPPGLQGS